jgi:uncharacterized protein YegL
MQAILKGSEVAEPHKSSTAMELIDGRVEEYPRGSLRFLRPWLVVITDGTPQMTGVQSPTGQEVRSSRAALT